MSCEPHRQLMSDYLREELGNADRLRLNSHLAGCGSCRSVLEEYRALWQALEAEPAAQPSAQSRARFQDFLAGEMAAAAPDEELTPTEGGWARRFLQLWPGHPGSALAYTVVLLFGGVLLGRLGLEVNEGGNPTSSTAEIATIQEELTELRDLMSVTLLGQDSIQARLRGVEYARRSGSNDPELIELLLQIAERDGAGNVRLAALDALEQHRTNPLVQERLYQSLAAESSLLEQLRKAELLLDAAGAERDQLLNNLIGEQRLALSVVEFLQASEQDGNVNQGGGRLIEL